jgi:uncharacterized YccA/Bax inhibitor family protein
MRVVIIVAMVMLLRDSGPYGIIFMDACVVITVAMVMLLRDSGPYGIIFMDACFVITVAMVMLVRDFGPYGIIFMNVCVVITHCHGNAVKGYWALWDNIYECVFTALDLPVILNVQFINN